MCKVNLTNVGFLIFIGMLFWSSSFEVCSARQGKHWKQTKASFRRQMAARQQGGSSATFNVLNYGAKGDGRTDDTKVWYFMIELQYFGSLKCCPYCLLRLGLIAIQAFEAAWAAACKLEASTVIVPLGSVFLVGPISFSGPNCQPKIVFQVNHHISLHCLLASFS